MSGVYRILDALSFQVPYATITETAPCPRCGKLARGSGVCKDCLTIDLGQYVGKELAEEYVSTLVLQRALFNKVLEAGSGN